MGEGYLAADAKLSRNIAVKVLSEDFASDVDRMARFVREAISASSLNHPNIITIYEINDDGPIPFIAMEFVEGITLRARLKAYALSPEETLYIAIQIAAALAAAHDAKVGHRDVKPDNVILCPEVWLRFWILAAKAENRRLGVASSGRFERLKFDKLTFTGNVVEEQAALSADGKYFAYTKADGETHSL